MAISALLGGMKSLWKGYSITHCLLGTFVNLSKYQQLDLPVSHNLASIIPGLLETHNNL